MNDYWDDYNSEFLFPGCGCGHPATDHDYSECMVQECPCEIGWEHT